MSFELHSFAVSFLCVIINSFTGLPAVAAGPDELHKKWRGSILIAQFFMEAFQDAKECLVADEI
jgi:hypothetical protein